MGFGFRVEGLGCRDEAAGMPRTNIWVFQEDGVVDISQASRTRKVAQEWSINRPTSQDNQHHSHTTTWAQVYTSIITLKSKQPQTFYVQLHGALGRSYLVQAPQTHPTLVEKCCEAIAYEKFQVVCVIPAVLLIFGGLRL